jgi:hypothetical protein
MCRNILAIAFLITISLARIVEINYETTFTSVQVNIKGDNGYILPDVTILERVRTLTSDLSMKVTQIIHGLFGLLK